MVYAMIGPYKEPAIPRGPEELARKHRGACSELIACTWLLQQGYEVFRNVSPYGAIDIIACDPMSHHLVKIDVKTCTPAGKSREALADSYAKKDARVRLLFVDPETNECAWGKSVSNY